MYLVFAASCFFGAMCCAVIDVAFLGHYDPKFGTSGFLGLYILFFTVASPAPLIGFAITSGLHKYRAWLVVCFGLVSGVIAFWIPFAVDALEMPFLVTFGAAAAWLFAAGLMCGLFARRRQVAKNSDGLVV